MLEIIRIAYKLEEAIVCITVPLGECNFDGQSPLHTVTSEISVGCLPSFVKCYCSTAQHLPF